MFEMARSERAIDDKSFRVSWGPVRMPPGEHSLEGAHKLARLVDPNKEENHVP